MKIELNTLEFQNIVASPKSYDLAREDNTPTLYRVPAESNGPTLPEQQQCLPTCVHGSCVDRSLN